MGLERRLLGHHALAAQLADLFGQGLHLALERGDARPVGGFGNRRERQERKDDEKGDEAESRHEPGTSRS
jgi:hypothetical protein